MSNTFSLQKTEDGSFTLYTSEYDENTHSIHGAYTEALYKHIFPSYILDRADEELVVLDIGFGLGYNVLALINELQRKPFHSLHIYSFEKERAIDNYLGDIHFNDEREERFDLVRKAFHNGEASQGAVTITMLYGDARESIKSLSHLKGRVSAVFHDPHSPGKNSELWSVEFFKELFALMDSSARLTTYSFAPQVRMGMVEAGFSVAPSFPEKMKKEGSVASKSSIEGAIAGDSLVELRNTIKATPYHDSENLSRDREAIRLHRVEAMAKRRKERTI